MGERFDKMATNHTLSAKICRKGMESLISARSVGIYNHMQNDSHYHQAVHSFHSVEEDRYVVVDWCAAKGAASRVFLCGSIVEVSQKGSTGHVC